MFYCKIDLEPSVYSQQSCRIIPPPLTKHSQDHTFQLSFVYCTNYNLIFVIIKILKYNKAACLHTLSITTNKKLQWGGMTMCKMHGDPVNEVFKCLFSSTLYSCYFSSYLTRFTTVFSNLALRASVQMFIPV